MLQTTPFQPFPGPVRRRHALTPEDKFLNACARTIMHKRAAELFREDFPHIAGDNFDQWFAAMEEAKGLLRDLAPEIGGQIMSVMDGMELVDLYIGVHLRA